MKGAAAFGPQPLSEKGVYDWTGFGTHICFRLVCTRCSHPHEQKARSADVLPEACYGGIFANTLHHPSKSHYDHLTGPNASIVREGSLRVNHPGRNLYLVEMLVSGALFCYGGFILFPFGLVAAVISKTASILVREVFVNF